MVSQVEVALLLGPLLLGVMQHAMSEPPARSWHRRLRRSPYTPPGAAFPLIWTWCYLSLGYASWVTWRALPQPLAAHPRALALAAAYGVHLLLLNSWGHVFFTRRRLRAAVGVMCALIATGAALVAAVLPLAPFASALCGPYLAWLVELTYLNWYMCAHNPGAALYGATKDEVVASRMHDHGE